MGSFSNFDLFLTCFDLDLYWPLMTFEVKIRQFIILIGIVWVNMQRIAALGVFLIFFKFWPLFDLFWPWPLLTSNDLWGQNKIVYNTYWYCMGIHAKNCSPWCIFTFLAVFDLFWPSVTFPDDLQWPLMIYKVKITYTILHGDIIWV